MRSRVIRAALRLAWITARRKRGSLLAFALGMAAFHYILVASYPAIGGAAAVESVVRTFPPGLRRLLKIAPNLQAGFGLRDYLALGFFHPVFLGLGSAFVVGRASDALAGQIETGAVYVLLSRPVPRVALVLGRMLELIVGAGLLALASWLGLALAVATTPLPQPIALGPFAAIATMAWALFCALAAGALIISSRGSRTPRVVGLGTAWTLIGFVLDVLPVTAESSLAVLNPWHHYDPQQIGATGGIEGGALAILLLWIGLGTVVSALLFGRRDLA